MSRRTLPTAPEARDGRHGDNEIRLRAGIHEDSGPTAGQMRSLIFVLFALAWCAARLLLSGWPGLASVPG